MNEYEIAAGVAVITWFESEGPLSKEIQRTETLTPELLQRWLKYWMLARTCPRATREELRTFLEYSRSTICNSINNSEPLRVVETLAAEGRISNGTRGRPTSLVSKFAFSCCPAIFLPYDRRARTALREMKYKIDDHDYYSYMEAFKEQIKVTTKAMDEQDIYYHNFTYNNKTMSKKLFYRRVADKLLMLRGGFSRDRMVRRIRITPNYRYEGS